MSINKADDRAKEYHGSSEEIDPTIYSKEFEAFVKFVGQHHSVIRNQLSYFLYPFYVYVYLILLFHEKSEDAKNFLHMHKNMFLQAKGYATKIDNLAGFQNIEQAWSDAYFSQFSKRKYLVNVSKNYLDCLKSYLKESKSVVLSSILNSYICFGNQSIDELDWIENEELDSEDQKDRLSEPNHMLFDLSCGNANICSVDVDFASNILACGLDNSTIQIWNLENNLLKNGASVKSNAPQKLFNQRSKTIHTEHSGPVYGLAMAPDKDLLISCSEDGYCQAWCTKMFKLVSTYEDVACPMWNIAVSSKLSYFATASMDAVVRLWHFERKASVRNFKGHTKSVDCVCFHPNSQYIASGSADKSVRLWTTQDGRSVREFVGHNSYINCMAFSNDGKHLASADDNGCIILWDIGSATKLLSCQLHRKSILSICYSQKNSMLASGGMDFFSKIWDVRCFNQSETSSPRKSTCRKIPLVSCQKTNSVVHFVSYNQDDVLTSVCSLNK